MNIPEASIAEVAPDLYRISVAMPPEFIPGGFSFNQYLLLDELPLLFHTGPRRLFGLVSECIKTVLPLEQLKFIAFSHVEADECGALPDFLAVAPNAQPVCSDIAAMVSVRDLVDIEPIGLADGQRLSTGHHQLIWESTPHLPHGWECGYLFDETSRILFCGDLFTQGGSTNKSLVHEDLVESSEAFRRQMDYFSHTENAPALMEKLAALKPETLACMHGSAWSGDGSAHLKLLARSLALH